MPDTSTNKGRRGPGRPRSEKARRAVLKSTLELLEKNGFNDLSIEAVASRAGVGKATVYRWWSNKAELVIAAFVSTVEEELRFPRGATVMESIHQQMKRWAEIFHSPLGQIIAAVIGAGQSEPEMLEAFRNFWVEPRRIEARQLLRKAIKHGDIVPGIKPDEVLDFLYGPLYLRLMLRHAPLDKDFADMTFRVVSKGLLP